MVDNGRVHPDCRNASNPYHECGVACLDKIAQDHHHGKKAKKKSGSFIETSFSFGRKKKGSDSQPTSPQEVPNSHAERKKKAQMNTNEYPADSFSPRTPVAAKSKVESQSLHSHSSSSSRQYSDESFSQDYSFENGRITISEIVPAAEDFKSNGSKSLPLGSFTCFAIAPQEIRQKENEKLDASPDQEVASPTAKTAQVTNGPTVGSLNFTFSGISRATEESDDTEAQSVISDSCVSAGKYQVKTNTTPILQLILDKYGDITASCKLETASLRVTYLELLCSVVQELQSISLNQLTKSKVNEFLAALKHVESAQIDVSWLLDILNELTEAVEIKNQQQTAEEEKENCSNLIETTKKELESMVEDLAQKEKAVADAKAQIDERKARLSELEQESVQLSETISSLCLKVEKFQVKPLTQKII